MAKTRSIPGYLIWIAALLWAPFPLTAQPVPQQGDTSQTSGTGFILAPAQDLTADETAPFAGVVVLNQERLLAQSLFGRRIQDEVESASRALATENREIEAQLTEEELRLTELRPTLSVDEFAALADDFDSRVEGIRRAQEAKARALQSQADAARNSFFEQSFPLLLQAVQARGAQVLMDSRAVLLSSDGVDITDEALALINAELGDGGDAPLIDLDGTASP